MKEKGWKRMVGRKGGERKVVPHKLTDIPKIPNRKNYLRMRSPEGRNA